MRPWIRRLRFSSNFAPGGRLRHEAYNGCCTKATLKIKRTNRHMRSISKYMVVNSFCPFSNALISIVWVNSQWIFPFANDCINYLIGYSMDLTFSPPLYQLVEAFFARARAGARRPGGTRAQKCFDRLVKEQTHWTFDQIIDTWGEEKGTHWIFNQIHWD